MKEQCKQAVAKALGKQSLTAQEATKIEQRVTKAMTNLARQDINKWRNMSKIDRLTAASEQVAKDIQSDLARKKQILAKDIIKQSQGLEILKNSGLPANQALDRMIAHNGDMSGITSLNSEYKVIANETKRHMWNFYTKIKGALGIWTDNNLMKDVARERFGEDTGNTIAKQIATELGKMYDDLRVRFNAAGGDIGDLGDNFGFNTIWEGDKLKDAGMQQWLDDALKNIDRSKYVDVDGIPLTNDQIKEMISYSFDSITTNGLNKLNVGEVIQGGAKVTNRMSQSRVLHWKNADAWLEMQQKYGALPFVDLIDSHIDTMAKNIALVEKFGSNPNRAFEILAQEAKRIDSANEVKTSALTDGIRRATTMYDVFANREMNQGSETLNAFGVAYRAWNVSTMLGSALLASLSDIAPMIKLARMHNLSVAKLMGNLAGELNPLNPKDRELSFSMGIAVDEITSSLGRFAAEDLTNVYDRASQVARISNTASSTIMRVSLLNAWTRATKAAWSKTLMNKYANLPKEKNWVQLDAEDQAFLKSVGLDERTWEVMGLAEPMKDGSGNPLMTTQSILNIPGDQLKHLGNPIEIKNQAVKKYFSHVLDEQGMAVIESGLRERTKLFGKTHGGSLTGFMARGMMQFKSFPVTFLMRHGTRALRDGVLSPTPFTYMIPLAMGMGIMGAISLQLGEIANGNNPLPMWDDNDPDVALSFTTKSMMKGGGLTLLGDIVAAGADTSGRDGRDFLLGPMGGDMVKIAQLTSGTANQILNGKDVTSKTNQIYMLAKSKIPGQNLWYAKTAMNRLMFDDVQNMIAPDYQQKYKRKMQKQGRSQWWESGEGLEGLNSINLDEVVK
ncbi:hypothetical protein KWE42_16135 [Acinetobacter pittii]|uniref:Uncharacterized protein n=1 Tax=Acinetobacter pittii TaxID=48296 RepID=A0AAE9MB64_ACIPI|nr:hypothetical protein [Acinetobacter pittii]AZP28430.1 hypothetical protein DLK06_04695 [Acinetobacter pittii]USU95565.1 hypothetical protein MWH18_04690 [Acinetobacter pittii]